MTREHLGTEMCWAVGDDVCNHASSAAVSNMRALQETETEHAHGVRRHAPTYTRARNAAAARRSARQVTYKLETESRASKNSREGKAPPDAAGGVPKVVPPDAAAPKACPKGCGALEGAPNNPWAGEPNEATCTTAGVWLGKVKPGAAGCI